MLINTSTPIRLFALSHNLSLEGAAISMYELMVGLMESGRVAPTIMALSDGPLCERYLERGIDVLPLPFSERLLRDNVKIYEVIMRLKEIIEYNEYHCVYANTLLGYPVIHAAKSNNKPSIWNIRESQSDEFWCDYLGSRYGLALSAFTKADAVIFVAEATRDLWRSRINIEYNHCIPNSLNISRFEACRTETTREEWRNNHGIDGESIVFLCVGTLHERKGQMDLIETVSGLPESEVRPVAVCIGDSGGAYSKNIHEFKKNLPSRLAKRIVILPREFEIADAYSAADVFVCCSRNESYPRVILEAMASSLPIVSTSVFGIAEQVQFGKNALEYEPGDLKTLRNHLMSLISNLELRTKMAAASHSRFHELDIFSDMISAYGDIIMKTFSRRLDPLPGHVGGI